MQLQHDRGNVEPAFCTTPDEVHDFIDYAVAHYNVDPARVYLTGLSCGAFGIWEYLAKYPRRRKGGGRCPDRRRRSARLAQRTTALSTSTPLWAFHGPWTTRRPLGSIEPMTALAGCPGVSADRGEADDLSRTGTTTAGTPHTAEPMATTSTPGCCSSARREDLPPLRERREPGVPIERARA